MNASRCRPDLLEPLREFLEDASGPVPPWDSAEASAEGVSGLLAWLAQRRGATEAAAFFEQEFVSAARLHAELGDIGRELQGAGLEAIVFKGPALTALYGGRLGLRPACDLDLLIPRGATDAFRAALGIPPIGIRQSGVMVDLQENLVGAERIALRARAFRFDLAEVWERSEPFGPGLRVLDPEHRFLHLAVHALKHGYSRLVWVLDLALALPEAETATLAGLARRTGTGRAAACALELVRRAFDRSSPLASELPRLGSLEQAVVERTLRREPLPVPGDLLTALSIPHPFWRLVYPLELALLRPSAVRRQFHVPLLRAWSWRIGHLLRRPRSGRPS